MPEFPDGPYSPDFDVAQLYDRLLRGKNKEPWNRSMGVYHPSSLGSECDRTLYYDRISVPPIPCNTVDLMSIFELGHGIHERMQGVLHAGVPDFESEVKVHVPELHMGGSCDGIFRQAGWVLEIKSIGKEGFSRLVRPHEEHRQQVHTYMVGLGIPRAQILYVNRDSGARRMFVVHFEQECWDAVTQRIERIEQQHVAVRIPPPRVESTYACRTCKFSYMCAGDHDGVISNAGTGTGSAELEQWVRGSVGSSRARSGRSRDRSESGPDAAAGLPGERISDVGRPAQGDVRPVPAILRLPHGPAYVPRNRPRVRSRQPQGD